MSLILLDGMEDPYGWGSIGISNWATVAGRNGNCQAMTNGAMGSFRFLSANETDTVTVGFAFRLLTAFGSTAPGVWLLSDNAATTHLRVQIQADYSLLIQRGTSGTLGVTIPNLVALNTWYYLEVQAKLHDTTGTYTVKLNGITVLSATGVDTKNAGTKVVFDSIGLSGPGTGGTFQVDDLYVESAAGDPFLGDIVIETLYPNGNGSVNAWTGSDGDSTNNYLLVDEAGAPNTADYVFSSTSAQQDLYTMSDLVATSGTIVGVCHAAHAARTDAITPRQIKLVNRRSTDSKSPSIDLATTYATYAYAFALDPETAAAWTIANVNALQSGVELV